MAARAKSIATSTGRKAPHSLRVSASMLSARWYSSTTTVSPEAARTGR